MKVLHTSETVAQETPPKDNGDHSWEYYTPEKPVEEEKYKSTAHSSYFEA